MRRLLRITGVEAVLPGVLKLTWSDGYEGVVDLRGVITDGEIFEHIRDPESFRKFVSRATVTRSTGARRATRRSTSAATGSREMAEEQAALLARASERA